MRKKSIFLYTLIAATLLLSACSDNDNASQPVETAKFSFEVFFSGTAGLKAAGSSYVPATTWANISQIQFFLYDAAGTVKFSAVEPVPSGTTGTKQYTYTTVPVGVYTVVAVANANSTSIAPWISSLSTTATTTWNAFNVRDKLTSVSYLTHAALAQFPTYADPSAATGGSANKPFAAPAEIFMASATGITITSGSSNTTQLTGTNSLKLKREVSMMRVRLNVSDTDAGVNNTSAGTGGVNWGTNTSALVYTLPNKMDIAAGNAAATPPGGTSASSTATNILVADGAFNNSASANSATCLDGSFTMWKDIIVFPNNGGRVNDLPTGSTSNGSDAATDQKYFIVVSAQGQAGHQLKDGTTLSSPTTIYWSGLISSAFYPNFIREVNLTLKSGGTTEIPVTPSQEGLLLIDVAAPLAWDNNIQDVSLTL